MTIEHAITAPSQAFAFGRRLLLAASAPVAVALLGQRNSTAMGLAGRRFMAAATPSAAGDTATPAAEDLIAIDTLLEPDATLVKAADAANARLRQNYSEGYSLDATHAPHVTLVQRFVRARDFDAVTTAVAQVLDTERPQGWPLTATSYAYAMWAGVAITVMVIERTPELDRLEQAVVDALEPFSVVPGDAAAFVTDPASPEINQNTIEYVNTFVPASSGKNYQPHITVGVAHEEFVKDLVAEPYTPVTGAVTDAAIFHLGNFGTAAKRLWSWNLQ